MSIERDRWAELRRLTPARIGLADDHVRTADLLALRADQALARDALRTALDVAALRAAFAETVVVDSAAADHRAHLLRPDLGRRLADGTELPAPTRPDLLFVLADGLSADAVNQHGPPFVHAVAAALPDWSVGPVVLARHARVALGDELGQRLGARFVAVCIGERPGLTSPRSMGVYLTADPRPGRTDAERNCISNISTPHGQSPEDAAAALVWLLGEAKRLGATGVALKDRSGPTPELG